MGTAQSLVLVTANMFHTTRSLGTSPPAHRKLDRHGLSFASLAQDRLLERPECDMCYYPISIKFDTALSTYQRNESSPLSSPCIYYPICNHQTPSHSDAVGVHEWPLANNAQKFTKPSKSRYGQPEKCLGHLKSHGFHVFFCQSRPRVKLSDVVTFSMS